MAGPAPVPPHELRTTPQKPTSDAPAEGAGAKECGPSLTPSSEVGSLPDTKEGRRSGHTPTAATTWDEPRPYDRHRVCLAEAHGGIDDVRERLSAVMSRVPSGDAYQHLLDAKNSILTAQDLIRAELEGSGK